MKRLVVAVALLGLLLPSLAGAVDIYLLQYGYEEPTPCDGAQHGNMFNAVYCSRPPTFEVFGDLESAKKRLRESSPVRAFKVDCWTFSGSFPTCHTAEMEIITDKDLREKAAKRGSAGNENIILFLDNATVVTPPHDSSGKTLP